MLWVTPQSGDSCARRADVKPGHPHEVNRPSLGAIIDATAGVAQLVERQPSKLQACSASPEKPGTSDGTPPTTSSSPSSRAQNPSTTDPDLVMLIDAWPLLPEAVKAGILAMVRAVQQTE